MASRGYPDSYEKGKPIDGLERVTRRRTSRSSTPARASTTARVVTDGGRVLCVGRRRRSVRAARDAAYGAVAQDQLGRRLLPHRHRPPRHPARTVPLTPLRLAATGSHRRGAISASSTRRTRRWSSCPSPCRAGTRSPRARPSGAAACAGSTSSAARPAASAALPCACRSG